MSDKYTIETVHTPQPKLNRNDLLQVMKYRYATKKWDPNKKISDADFNAILEAGRLSPTSFGFEPYQMIILQDKDLRQAIKPHAWGAQNALDNASHMVVFLAHKKEDITFGSAFLDHMTKEVQSLPDDVYKFYGQAYNNFSKNDFKTLESDRTAFDWSAKQCYIVMANMMVMAAYQGIDSCPIEGFVPAELDRILGKEAGLYDVSRMGIACMTAFGYRDELPHRDKTRRPLSESVQWK